jgi:hypothetical protein
MPGKNGNSGNGDDDHHGEEWNDRTPTLVGHPANREVLKIIGNLRIEARHHSVQLNELYVLLRASAVPAPEHWAQELVDELDRHHQADGAQIEQLRATVGR